MLEVLLKTARATVSAIFSIREVLFDAVDTALLARLQGACWVGEFDSVATASDVLTGFCRTYHLNRQSCALYYVQGGELPLKQLLRKVRLLHQWLKAHGISMRPA